jgi:predicted transcriptional regulator of viral defense system
MNQSEALAKLRSQYVAAFTTRDTATLLGVTVNAAAKLLERLATVGLVTRIMRGRWVIPDKFNRLCLPELVAAQPAYVSLQSALSYHGMIDQIPSAVYGITCGRGGMFNTPLGRVSLHHVSPDFFAGYETPTEIGWLKIATPEKALVDILYLRMTSLGDFKGLPEVEWPKNFRWKVAQKFARLTPSRARRTLILSALEDLQAAAVGSR